MKASDRRNFSGAPALAALLLLGLFAGPAAAAGAPAPGAAAPAQGWGANGRVEPLGEERQLRFPVGGRLAKVAVEEGQAVKAGDVLAEIESGEERSALARAEAELARAGAQTEKVENGARAEERAAADAEVALAKVELALVEAAARKERCEVAAAGEALRKAETTAAQRVADRVARLREGDAKAASQEELDTAADRLAVARAAEEEAGRNLALVAAPAREEDLEVARARLKLAEERAALIKAKARAEDLAIAKAELAAAQARRDEAAARLEKTRLVSPVDGTVLKIFQRVGEAANPLSDTPVITVGDMSKLMVRAEVDEVDVLRVHRGQAVRIDATGVGGVRAAGKVVRVGQIMGRKRLISNDPREKVDTKVLEVLVELEGKPNLPVGYRVTVKSEGNR